jgi:hypothetical protein
MPLGSSPVIRSNKYYDPNLCLRRDATKLRADASGRATRVALGAVHLSSSDTVDRKRRDMMHHGWRLEPVDGGSENQKSKSCSIAAMETVHPQHMGTPPLQREPAAKPPQSIAAAPDPEIFPTKKPKGALRRRRAAPGAPRAGRRPSCPAARHAVSQMRGKGREKTQTFSGVSSGWTRWPSNRKRQLLTDLPCFSQKAFISFFISVLRLILKKTSL